jgi:CheY-like chemotaxis protein
LPDHKHSKKYLLLENNNFDNKNISDKNNIKNAKNYPKVNPSHLITLRDCSSERSEHDLYEHNIDKEIEDDNIKNPDLIRILVVDDERLIRKSGINVITKFFKSKGKEIHIEECSDGIECLFKLYESLKAGIRYKFVVTDETMDFLKGSESAEIIKNLISKNVLYDLKIFLNTSYQVELMSDFQSKNFDGVFTKPLSKSVMEKIEEILD